MQSVILIHPFHVPVPQEQAFLSAWKLVDDYMKKQPGFIETKLHKVLAEFKLSEFNYINIAHWENTEVFKAAISGNQFVELAKAVLSYSKGPGLYEIIYQ